MANKYIYILRGVILAVKGLCLGAGGVKGFVHLGVLQYLQEIDVKFDMVSGCSVGSIVGGLYALGFSPRDMVKELIKIGLDDPKKLLYFRFSDKSISGILNKITTGAKFNQTDIPLGIVAVDMYSGKEKVFSQGNIADAMTASSAIPPYLRPYKIKDITYVDGAFLNSVPADIVKDMGAEKILSVNLSYGRPFNYGNKTNLDKFYPKNQVPIAEITEQCYKYSTVIIEPDLREYKAFSFTNFDTLFDIGYNSAQAISEKLKVFQD